MGDRAFMYSMFWLIDQAALHSEEGHETQDGHVVIPMY